MTTAIIVGCTLLIVASALVLAWTFVEGTLTEPQRTELHCRLRRRHVWILVVDPAARRTYLQCPSCHVTTRGLFV